MSPSKRSRRSMYCTCTGGCREDWPPAPGCPPRRPAYLHGHHSAVVQPGAVHLGQACRRDGLVVKLLEELVGQGPEVFEEQLVHLAGQGGGVGGGVGAWLGAVCGRSPPPRSREKGSPPGSPA